ncbi:(2Fe-2S)-binding protein [Streptosporangium subroseum]|uniref:(2Fe-2S)-binding protein n=1 Tax=Streptosporangium subroseum TaxID=106412 RepID=UPI0030883897|nr:(2Fe-2S)-binding protein [Streptosporangium subroseum]
MTVRLRFRLNHEDVEIHVRDPASTLLDVLRDDLGLTGTKSGCAVGYCGACTVIVDGEAVPACLRMVGLLEGREVRTIEDLSGPEGLDPVQAAFVRCAGLQCGFCTPGHVMALRALLDEEPEPDDERIRQTVDGNYCRCTGYVKILDAAREAVALQKAVAVRNPRAQAATSRKERARTGARTSREARAGAATSPEGRRR